MNYASFTVFFFIYVTYIFRADISGYIDTVWSIPTGTGYLRSIEFDVSVEGGETLLAATRSSIFRLHPNGTIDALFANNPDGAGFVIFIFDISKIG